MPIMKVDAQGYKREKDNSSYFLLQYSDKQSPKSALFTQPHEKNGHENRNRFILSVDQLGLEPRTSRL